LGQGFNEFWGRVHFALTFVGMNLTFMPMHELGLMGMNRRIALYDPQFTDLNVLATIGSYIMAVSTIPFLINAAWSWRYGPKAPANPWRALTMEWRTLSPPHIENFEELPVLTTGPYDYGLGYIAEEDPAELYEHAVPAPVAG